MHKIASWKLVKIIYANHHKRRCKKSATKPVDSLDMEAHGL